MEDIVYRSFIGKGFKLIWILLKFFKIQSPAKGTFLFTEFTAVMLGEYKPESLVKAYFKSKSYEN